MKVVVLEKALEKISLLLTLSTDFTLSIIIRRHRIYSC